MTSQTYNFSYTYNLDGSLASQTYPSGRVVNFTYDASGRPYAVGEAGGGASYLNSVAYAAHGGIDNMQLGNQLTEQTCYNDLLQPTARRLGNATSVGCAVQTGSDLLHLGFGYGAATQNNGNMMQQTIWAPDNGSGQAWQVTQDYTYDQVNRLATSAEKLSGVTQWTRSYSYDHFGNRWISGATGHTLHMATPTSPSAIQASTNRLTGAGIVYDNAGNLTAHPFITPGSGSMAYDTNNKMTAFAKTGAAVATKYDAAHRRIRKIHNGDTTVWVYDAIGKLAAEYTTEQQSDDVVYYRTTDHLRSTRLTTSELGSIVARRDFFPFGERVDSNLSGRGSVVDEGLVSFSADQGSRHEFTSQQRDPESNLDYFNERNLYAAIGRFLPVDPRNANAKRGLPQSWNAYTYASNQPLRFADPTGRNDVDLSNCYLDPVSDELAETVYICPDVEGSTSHEPYTIDVTPENAGTVTTFYVDSSFDLSSSGAFGASGSASSSGGAQDTDGDGGGGLLDDVVTEACGQALSLNVSAQGPHPALNVGVTTGSIAVRGDDGQVFTGPHVGGSATAAGIFSPHAGVFLTTGPNGQLAWGVISPTGTFHSWVPISPALSLNSDGSFAGGGVVAQLPSRDILSVSGMYTHEQCYTAADVPQLGSNVLDAVLRVILPGPPPPPQRMDGRPVPSRSRR